ncbi:MAG: DUF1080 domain-containing protein [Tannerella sp.]|jgi:type 1 glutamine amidotransferase|nr:DUF1080 domain-containing protein [Tannerella sp.]
MNRITKKRALLAGLLIIAGLTSNVWKASGQTTVNSLSEKEKKQGWTLLFNGVDLEGWTSVGKQTPPEKGWTVENGVLTVNKGGPTRAGDIISKALFSEFDLVFEFRLTKAANSGVKYLFTNYEKGGWLGNEYQVLDDDFHPDAKEGRDGNRKTASFYDVFPVTGKKQMKPTGEWNIGRVVVQGSKVTHYLNDKKVLTYDRKSKQYEEAVKLSKFKDAQPFFGTVNEGHILLQEHNDEASFRNIKIKDLSNGVIENNRSQHNDNMIKTLIVTGQNNHNWQVSNVVIKQILENSGLFTVDVAVSPPSKEDMSGFKPNFAGYKLVILDYNGDKWPVETERAFLDYVNNGGGIVVYHAADNAFRNWTEYNKIIGFGGWNGRNETDGPYIYVDKGEVVYDNSPGAGGSHGPQHEFVLNCGNAGHPVTKGLPAKWLHAADELYDRMRGPGKVKDALFWSYSSPDKRGSGHNEISISTIDYGKARIFHTTLGHAGKSLEDNVSMQCTGFQVTLLRGAEWAATGKVTQKTPDDFPTETKVSMRLNYGK